jgi:hypothetical protein
VGEGSLTLIAGALPVTLAAGHRLRGLTCIICRAPVGGDVVVVVGVAGLAGPGCRCGGIPGDLFLIHEEHMPVNVAAAVGAVARALGDGHDHDWELVR